MNCGYISRTVAGKNAAMKLRPVVAHWELPEVPSIW
jgi:hypothetical protein